MSRLEDDSVSLHSTSPSEGQDEYVIDGGILAERVVDGETQYLVKWEGYPEYRNTWEPEENFQSSDTLKEWREKKMRITRGLDEPFDVDAFEERQESILEEIAVRKRNRKLKRRRLGIFVESSSSSSDTDKSSSDEPLLRKSKQSDLTARIEDSQKDQIDTTRKQSEKPKIWTDQERRALEAGILKVGGPQWDVILANYGPNGTVNRDLERMNEYDLQEMASNMSKEFLSAGKNPPSWLEQEASQRSRDKSQPNNIAPYPRKSPNNIDSPDPYQGDDLREKPRSILGDPPRNDISVKLKLPYKGTARDNGAESSGPKSFPNSERFNFSTLFQQLSAKAASQTDSSGQLVAVKRYPEAIGNRPIPRDQFSITKSGAQGLGQIPKQLGAYGAGPARLKPSKAKAGSHTWKPKIKAREGPISGAERTYAPKFFHNMATQNRVSKKGREEPAPNPDSLALIDPRTGKVPPRLPPSPVKSSGAVIENRKPSYGREPRLIDGNAQQYQHDQEIFLAESTSASIAVPNALSGLDSVTGIEQDSTQNPNNIEVTRQPTDSPKRDLFRRPVDGFTVNGQLEVGLYDPKSYLVRFQVLDRALQQLLLTIKSPHRHTSFAIKKACLAAEYEKFFTLEDDDFIGWGYIIPEPVSRDQIDLLATQLATDLSGALCFAEFYNMVIYPIGNKAWAFLDRNLPATPEEQGALLRFIVRKPLHPALAVAEGLDQATYWAQNPERYHQLITTTTDDIVTRGIDMVFRDVYDIDYLRLVSDRRPNFFLCFIPAGCESYEKDPIRRHALRLRTSEEHDLTVEFLHENGAKVFSLQEVGSYQPNMNGSWEYFVRKKNSGVIIIHDACKRIDQIPKLAQSLHNAISVWRISLEPMDEGVRHPHLIRLFPHGAVILLTESLVLYRPYEALRILLWFRLTIISGNEQKTPYTWKLAIRPHACSWLLDILDLYEDTRADVFGCGKQVFADIYSNIIWLLEHENLPTVAKYAVLDSMATLEEDDETPGDDAPLVAPASLRAMQDRKEWNVQNHKVDIDHDKIRLNDDLLVQWFAEWAVLACENFRRFHVVLGYEPGDTHDSIATRYEKRWGHIETFTPESFYERHKVTSQAELDVQEAERLRQSRRRGPNLLVRNAAARKKEREAKRADLKKVKLRYREAGLTEKQIRDRSRIHLQQTGASLKEIREVEIDMDLQERWYGGPQSAGLGNDWKRFEQIEAMLAEERAEEERVKREDRERLLQGRDKVMDWITEGGGGSNDDDDDVGQEEDLDGEPMDISE